MSGNMRLFKNELYKIANRRIVKICMAVIIIIQLFLLLMTGVYGRGTVINGKTYKGFQAIRMDRQITAEFEGEVTDEKTQAIVEKYGFVRFDGEEYLEESNYLNDFLFENGLTDGNIKSWTDYVNPSRLIPLEETVMGMLAEQENVTFTLQYTKGWRVYLSLGSMGAIFACLFVIVTLSSVFAEEYSLKAANILLTTVHGKRQDIVMKIAAAFVFAIASFAVILLFTFLMCGICFGFGGLDALAGPMAGMRFSDPQEMINICTITIWQFFLLMTLLGLMAVLIMTAFVIFSSAVSRSSFVALIYGLLFFVLPGGVWIFLSMWDVQGERLLAVQAKIRDILYCCPMYLCANGIVETCAYLKLWIYKGTVFALVFFPSILFAYRKYRNHQVV